LCEGSLPPTRGKGRMGGDFLGNDDFAIKKREMYYSKGETLARQ